jgi:hypothetical protein
MKKTTFFVLAFLVATTVNLSAQTDFYAGKWVISVFNSPLGDVSFKTDLVRKDGKLTGELEDANDASKPKRPITKVVEDDKGIEIFFPSSQGGNDVSTKLEKVDADNLKGTTMSYETKAARVKEVANNADYFAGKWEFKVFETPNGDVVFTTNLTRKDGKLTGELKAEGVDQAIPIDDIEEPSTGKISVAFRAQGYDLKLHMEKIDGDNLKGMLLDMFKAEGKRVK